MSDEWQGSELLHEVQGAELEAYKRIDNRFTITVKVTEERYLAIVLDGVLSVHDRGWQSITRLMPELDGTPVRLVDLERKCKMAHEGGLPFTLQLLADDGEIGLEVVAHALSMKRDTVESPDELPESAY
jgi:hypothetical protein